jgi:hypothetical protein
MDAMYIAVLFFWIPMSSIVLGLWVSFSSKQDSKIYFGRILTVISFLLVCISPWTAPLSPSSSIGHLIGFIVGPSILLLTGLYLITFSGNVPVGKLPYSDKRLGFICLFIGTIWFLMMQWGDLTPMYYGDELNKFWLIFFPTMLILLCSLSSVLSISMLVIGDNRQKESRFMAAISLFTLIIIICAMTIDGKNVSSNQFSDYLWLSVSDLLGISVGVSLSILIFGLVIYLYESNLEQPGSVNPPSKKELSLASIKISQNIGGEESE